MVNENEKENVSYIAVFQVSLQPTESRAEAWGEGNPKNDLAGLLRVFVYTM